MMDYDDMNREYDAGYEARDGEVARLEKTITELRTKLAEQSEPYLIAIIADIRQALGDNGKLMLDELAPHIKAKLAEREGWKLVPIEPTDTMVAAGISAYHNGELFLLSECYKAMINASPNEG